MRAAAHVPPTHVTSRTPASSAGEPGFTLTTRGEFSVSTVMPRVETIFRGWVCVGHVSAVAGGPHSFLAADTASRIGRRLGVADPVVQALSLTSIVIAFGATVLLLRIGLAVERTHATIELEDLEAWATDGPPVAVRLYTAPGGFGKTRLLGEHVRLWGKSGWGRAGFLGEGKVLELGAEVLFDGEDKPLLVVVDYAESRCPTPLPRCSRPGP